MYVTYVRWERRNRPGPGSLNPDAADGRPRASNRSLRITLTGQGHGCTYLADGIRPYSELEVRRAPFDGIADAFDVRRWIALLQADLVVRVGFRPGARTWRGRAIDTAFRASRILRPRQRTAYYWIGTDVLGVHTDIQSGAAPRWTRRELDTASHAAGSDSLVEELRTIGVRARSLPHAYKNIPKGSNIAPLPERFTALTYIPDFRPAFYGLDSVLHAARLLPEIPFRILGGTGTTCLDVPGNVEFLGWQEDAEKWFRDSSCVIRLVQHDGAGGTALEGLAHGRPVICSRAQEDMIHVPFGDSERLAEVLGALLSQHLAGEFRANEAVALKTRRRYAPDSCYPLIAEWLSDAVAGRES